MFLTWEVVFFKEFFKLSGNYFLNLKEDIRMQICNGIIQFSSIQNLNYLGRIISKILHKINTAEIKKHPKTLQKRLGLK